MHFWPRRNPLPYYNATLSPLSPKEQILTNASIKNGKDLSSNENNQEKIIEISNSPLMKDVDDHRNKDFGVFYRIKSFFLSFSDKNDIRNNKKLNSDLINFSKLLNSQFPDVNGFQNCSLAPVRKDGTWK